MKIKLLMAGLLGLVSATTFAQKGELNNAQSEYDKYESLSTQKSAVFVTTAKTSLNNAKISIDKASTNQKTSPLPLTFALKASIYASLALEDSVQTNAAVDYSTSSDALKQAKTLDTKNENSKLIQHTVLLLTQYQLNKGMTEYQNKKYDEAYKSFDSARQMIPDDTTTILNTAIAAISAKNYTAAIANYNKLVTTNYSRKQAIYNDLSTLYLVNKDTTGALKSINEALLKYPTSSDLRKREIEIAIQRGQQNDILTKIQSAIANDPKNKTLYYYEGLTYSQLADDANAKSAKAKDATSKNSLHQTALDNYTKAVDLYKKALEIDPNYFDANLNLGYVLIRPAIDTYNAAVNLPANKQKEYDVAIAKAGVQFDAAKPYILKAVELNPKSPDALTNLMSYYRGKKDSANAAKTKAQLDALKDSH